MELTFLQVVIHHGSSQVVTWGEKIFTNNQPLTELHGRARVVRISSSERAFAALLEDGPWATEWVVGSRQTPESTVSSS